MLGCPAVGGVGGHQAPSLCQGHKGLTKGIHQNSALVSGSTGTIKNQPWYPANSGQIFLDERLSKRYDSNVSLKPGGGFRTEQCGSWVYTGVCSKNPEHSGTDGQGARHSCGKLSCPDCYPDYLKEKAGDITGRFDGYSKAKMQQKTVLIPGEKREILPRHIVFTVSPGHIADLVARSVVNGYFNESLFLDKFRTEYNEILKASGLIGGSSFYHDARLRHPGTGADGAKAKMMIGREAKTAGALNDTSAAWRMYQYINGRKDWQNYYRFSPHFHMIGFGHLQNIDEFQISFPGWKYHNKGTVRDAGGLSHYLLSHVALIGNRKAVTWFGRLSQKALGKEQAGVEYETKTCEICGAPLVISDSVRPDLIGRELTTKKIRYTWFFQICGPPGGP